MVHQPNDAALDVLHRTFKLSYAINVFHIAYDKPFATLDEARAHLYWYRRHMIFAQRPSSRVGRAFPYGVTYWAPRRDVRHQPVLYVKWRDVGGPPRVRIEHRIYGRDACERAGIRRWRDVAWLDGERMFALFWSRISFRRVMVDKLGRHLRRVASDDDPYARWHRKLPPINLNHRAVQITARAAQWRSPRGGPEPRDPGWDVMSAQPIYDRLKMLGFDPDPFFRPVPVPVP